MRIRTKAALLLLVPALTLGIVEIASKTVVAAHLAGIDQAPDRGRDSHGCEGCVQVM